MSNTKMSYNDYMQYIQSLKDNQYKYQKRIAEIDEEHVKLQRFSAALCGIGALVCVIIVAIGFAVV